MFCVPNWSAVRWAVYGETFRAKGSSFIGEPCGPAYESYSTPRLGNSPTERPGHVRLDGRSLLPRKEVIQPHLPVQLPCYDFAPVTNPTFGNCLKKLAH